MTISKVILAIGVFMILLAAFGVSLSGNFDLGLAGIATCFFSFLV